MAGAGARDALGGPQPWIPSPGFSCLICCLPGRLRVFDYFVSPALDASSCGCSGFASPVPHRRVGLCSGGAEVAARGRTEPAYLPVLLLEKSS